MANLRSSARGRDEGNSFKELHIETLAESILHEEQEDNGLVTFAGLGDMEEMEERITPEPVSVSVSRNNKVKVVNKVLVSAERKQKSKHVGMAQVFSNILNVLMCLGSANMREKHRCQAGKCPNSCFDVFRGGWRDILDAVTKKRG